MICVHCGYCCIKLCVVTINKEYATETFKLKNLSEENTLVSMSDEACPHVTLDNGKFLCGVHDMPWYKDTPCASHGQIEESPSSICRMGEYIQKNKNMQDNLREIYESSKNQDDE